MQGLNVFLINLNARNGSGVKTGTWYAGSVKLISETPLQMYNSILRGFNMKNDLLGETSPYTHYYSDFIETLIPGNRRK